MIDILTAILSLNSTAECDVYAEDINTINWRNNTTPISEALITAEVTRLQAAYAALEYSRNRKSAYDLLNQDEMRYDDVKNSTTTWVDAIDAIKQEFPK